MLPLLLLPTQFSGLEAILNSTKLEGAAVSAFVTRSNGEPVFERNSGLHVIPASNQKLLSAAFALHNLGPAYRPVTSFWKFPNRTVVESTGDPLLTFQQLIQLRERLQLNRRLPVYVKEPFAPQIPSTWEFDDLPNKYAAPITAFAVDRGSFELWQRGGKIIGEPHLYGINVEEQATEEPVRIDYDPVSRKVTIHGKRPANDQRLDTLSVWEPDRAAALLIGSEFKATRETISAIPDGTIIGGSVADMLPACLQPSDNNIAEKLLLMGARTQGELPTDSYPAARERLKNFLIRLVGIDRNDVNPYDGSGMSRHNYVTTRALGKLLQWAVRQPTAQVWRQALAAPGKGTLANRLKDVPFTGKTGTLDMVSALSGYVRHKTGQELIVSVVLNQYACTAADAREIVDSFVQQVSVMDLPAMEGN